MAELVVVVRILLLLLLLRWFSPSKYRLDGQNVSYCSRSVYPLDEKNVYLTSEICNSTKICNWMNGMTNIFHLRSLCSLLVVPTVHSFHVAVAQDLHSKNGFAFFCIQ